jgi:uncharacterized membrane protein YfhO
VENSLVINQLKTKKLFPYGLNSSTYFNQISYSGYTPYQYLSWLQLERSQLFEKIINRPFVYVDDLHIVNDSNNVTLSLLEFSNNNFTFYIETKKQLRLELSQNYHKYWKAYIDDAKTTIFKSNMSLMSVIVPKGIHIVKFEFKPLLLRISFFISFFSFLFILIIAFFCNRNF